MTNNMNVFGSDKHLTVDSVEQPLILKQLVAIDFNPSAYFLTGKLRSFYLIVSKVDGVITEVGARDTSRLLGYLGEKFPYTLPIEPLTQEALDDFERIEETKRLRGPSNLNRVVKVVEGEFVRVYIPSLSEDRPLYEVNKSNYSVDKVISEIKSMGVWVDYKGVFLLHDKLNYDSYKQGTALRLFKELHPQGEEIESSYREVGEDNFVGQGYTRRVYKSKCGKWAFKVSKARHGQNGAELYNWVVNPLSVNVPVDYAFISDNDDLVVVLPLIGDKGDYYVFESLEECITELNQTAGRTVATVYRDMPLMENLLLLQAWRDSCRKVGDKFFIVDYGELVEDKFLWWESFMENSFMFKDRGLGI